MDCKSPDRIFNDFTVITEQFVKDRIKVIIVGKQLGYKGFYQERKSVDFVLVLKQRCLY